MHIKIIYLYTTKLIGSSMLLRVCREGHPTCRTACFTSSQNLLVVVVVVVVVAAAAAAAKQKQSKAKQSKSKSSSKSSSIRRWLADHDVSIIVLYSEDAVRDEHRTPV